MRSHENRLAPASLLPASETPVRLARLKSTPVRSSPLRLALAKSGGELCVAAARRDLTSAAVSRTVGESARSARSGPLAERDSPVALAGPAVPPSGTATRIAMPAWSQGEIGTTVGIARPPWGGRGTVPREHIRTRPAWPTYRTNETGPRSSAVPSAVPPSSGQPSRLTAGRPGASLASLLAFT